MGNPVEVQVLSSAFSLSRIFSPAPIWMPLRANRQVSASQRAALGESQEHPSEFFGFPPATLS
jgi:hypothetical protein